MLIVACMVCHSYFQVLYNIINWASSKKYSAYKMFYIDFRFILHNALVAIMVCHGFGIPGPAPSRRWSEYLRGNDWIIYPHG